MSIRFILGRSGTGKTKRIFDEIKAANDAQPAGDPIYFLIPDQMAFHTEYQLLSQSKLPSLMRVQALSFNRLAFRILQETGGLSRHHLDEVGLSLLLQKVMNDQKDNLQVFYGYSGRPGFIEKVQEALSEFKSYGVNPQSLAEALKSPTPGLSMKSAQKIHDLSVIYEKFNDLALGKYLIKEDYYDLLATAIEESTAIAHSDFYIDGYHIFNSQEELILLQLMKHAKSVTLVFTHDPNSDARVFSLPRRTVSRLQTLASEAGLSYTVEEEGDATFRGEGAISHLEKNFLQGGGTEKAEGIHFFAAANKRVEVEEAARRIHRLVHEEGCAYSDIAIYTADTGDYDDLITSLFPKYGIPFFLDAKEPMLHHPLMAFLYHVFDLILHGWRHEAMFTLIKTGIFMDVSGIKGESAYYPAFQKYMEKADVLENYCLFRNIHKKNWVGGQPWEVSRYRGLGRDYVKTDADLLQEEMLEKLRQQIAGPLAALEEEMKKAATFKEKAICLFELLETLDVPKKLSLMEEAAQEGLDLQRKKQHEQVWNRLLSLFEQLVEIGGDELATTEGFAAIFKAGLEKMTFVTVPPSLDQVAIGQLRRARYQLVHDLRSPGLYGIRHGMVLGFNEGSIPATLPESSLIGEGEREALSAMGIQLAPSLEMTQVDDLFVLYTVLTSPRETLTLSYAISDDSGQEYLPSYLFNHVLGMFFDAQVSVIGREYDTDIYAHLTTVGRSVAHLVAVLKKSPHLKSYYGPLLDYYEKEHPLIRRMVDRILGYSNEAVPLSTDLAKGIYGSQINASVSRIELFNQCHFSHFVRYGLGLRERELYKLDLPHIGEMYHEALKRIASLIENEGRTFADLSEQECKALSEMAANELSEQLLFQILKRNKRMRLLTARLTQVLYKTLIGLKYQGGQSAFKPAFFELPFGSEKDSGIRLKPEPLGGGFQLSLKGIVDRIDVAKKDGETFVRVIDYKSSKKELPLDAVYYGLSLQLLTYLDVVLSNSLQLLDVPAKAGGLLYFHVHRPFISDNTELLSEENLKDLLSGVQLKEYKMSGYLPQDYEVAALSDLRLGADSPRSDIVPITLKKDGSFAATGNKLLPEESLKLLRDYTKSRITSSAASITQGKNSINPSRYGEKMACEYCPYRGICQFDPDFSGNAPRTLVKMKPEEALGAMQDSLEGESL
ncbi:MAG: helicase-exonuclease AddAB subunit AddB [Turicibacter sp.]|nr:helicase-exonuclease AddAB subunit AddB [Turicibacter sp.]